MASKRNKNRNNKPGTQGASAAVTPATGTPEQVLPKIEKAAFEHATEDDIKAMETAPPPPPEAISGDLIKRAAELNAMLESQRDRLAKEKDEATKQSVRIESDRTELKKKDDALREREANISKRGEQLLKDEADLLQRHEDIIRRECDADAGFSRRSREALSKLEEEAETIREQLGSHRKQIADERAKLERELEEVREEHAGQSELARKAALAKLDAQHKEMEQVLTDLAAEEKRLRKLEKDLDLDRELLDEDRKAFDEKVAQHAAREIELKEGKIRDLTERLNAARANRDEFAKLLSDREEADRRFGGEPPEEVLKRIRTLEDENKKLDSALKARPSAEASQRLEHLETQRELWDSDRLKLLDELGEAREEAKRRRIAVTELEALRDEKRSLESANALLHEANRQIRSEVDKLIKGAEGKSPFPSCSAMDSNNELQSTLSTTDTIRSLSDFADDVRHGMVLDPKNPENRLYYSAEDVRCFLGGLAMSRLHLLQGISGTGKTSLPLAFARAIGAGSAIIEVQAGWRDRQDLIGHFNTFERRFYESEFLQAIYRASTMRHRDIPFIVVLDEMNLSHPEQYFADLLSALEQDQHRQRLVLMTAAVDPAPRLLTEGGTKMPIPTNVWFVGTANHDETTKDFADKTYDRAHVMELPRNFETFERKDIQPQSPFSLKALNNAFDAAVATHRDAAAKAYDFIRYQLGETLGRRFRVGCGNRLGRQMSFYIPVVVAAGGTLGEATDHILASKLLRKIRDRHDNKPEDIIALRERIQTDWSLLDKRSEPRRSLALLSEELHRLGHDED